MMDDPTVSRSSCGYTAEVMVEMYLKEPLPDRRYHVHPLEYWKVKKSVWNSLAIMACKYLSIPRSSASSESLFSSAADVISRESNRLKPERAEKLLFLNLYSTILFLISILVSAMLKHVYATVSVINFSIGFMKTVSVHH